MNLNLLYTHSYLNTFTNAKMQNMLLQSHCVETLKIGHFNETFLETERCKFGVKMNSDQLLSCFPELHNFEFNDHFTIPLKFWTNCQFSYSLNIFSTFSELLQAIRNNSVDAAIFLAGYTPDRMLSYSMTSPHLYGEYFAVSGPHTYRSTSINSNSFVMGPFSKQVWLSCLAVFIFLFTCRILLKKTSIGLHLVYLGTWLILIFYSGNLKAELSIQTHKPPFNSFESIIENLESKQFRYLVYDKIDFFNTFLNLTGPPHLVDRFWKSFNHNPLVSHRK